MSLIEILKKVSEGKELTTEEKAFLASYKEDENRIPKSRLDEVITQKKELQKQVDSMSAKQSEMEEQLEGLKNAGLSAEEKAKKDVEKEIAKRDRQIETLTKERDEANESLSTMSFDSSVSKVAAKYGFTDSEYLGFLVKSGKIDLADEKKTVAWVKELETSKPGLFKSQVKNPGGGTKPEGNPEVKEGKARVDELLKKPNLTRKEAAEVAAYEEQQKAAQGNTPGGETK